jgi:hypothetical protein
MLITNKPEPLEARAEVLEKGAAEIAARADQGLVSSDKALALLNAQDMKSEAADLRARAATLRKRRTDDVRQL